MAASKPWATISTENWPVLTSTVNRGCCRASVVRIGIIAMSNTAALGASIRNSPVTCPRSALNPSIALPISTSAGSTPAINRVPASVTETLRVVRANKGVPSRIEEGILPGGGVALLRAGKAFDRLKPENDDQRHGIEIVRKALSWPARQIAINAGEDGSI